MRGELLTSGWTIEQVGGVTAESALVTQLVHMDPKQPFSKPAFDVVFNNQMQLLYNLKVFQKKPS